MCLLENIYFGTHSFDDIQVNLVKSGFYYYSFIDLIFYEVVETDEFKE